MIAERGVCPSTGEYCEPRVGCESVLAEDKRLLQLSRDVLESVSYPKAVTFLSRLVPGRDLLADATEETRQIEDEARLIDGYLALNCAGQRCTLRDAMERDNFELETAGEVDGR